MALAMPSLSDTRTVASELGEALREYRGVTDLMTRVLLIEDDGETAGEIVAELTDRGFQVDWSSDGADGLAKARELRPDAMIVDRLLPGMDGLSVIEALRTEQV